jgi:predicted RNA binding protein YcfA (HicA-like mRNA interferase family)
MEQNKPGFQESEKVFSKVGFFSSRKNSSRRKKKNPEERNHVVPHSGERGCL